MAQIDHLLLRLMLLLRLLRLHIHIIHHQGARLCLMTLGQALMVERLSMTTDVTQHMFMLYPNHLNVVSLMVNIQIDQVLLSMEEDVADH